MDDYLTEIDQRLKRKTPAARKRRIKVLASGASPYMSIPQTVEWICLTQNVDPWEAERQLREKLADGSVGHRWADD